MVRPKRRKPYKNRRVELAAQRKRNREQNRTKIITPLTTPTPEGAPPKSKVLPGLGVKVATKASQIPRTIPHISRKPRRRTITIVSRVGQPQITTKIEPLERKSYPPTSVSSTWLSTIGYFFNAKIGTFTTKTGRQYKIIDFDFETFEEWYYAHSKGTFFNQRIRDKYTIKGTL